jgi:hypothetical protein
LISMTSCGAFMVSARRAVSCRGEWGIRFGEHGVIFVRISHAERVVPVVGEVACRRVTNPLRIVPVVLVSLHLGRRPRQSTHSLDLIWVVPVPALLSLEIGARPSDPPTSQPT